MMAVSGVRAVSIVSDDAPRASDGRILISVRGLLEWAFAVECASIDFDEVGAIGPSGYPAFSATAGICGMLELGDEPGVGVRVDTTRGHSDPHEDAELVVTVLRNAVDWSMAVRVAELARACRTPRWDLGGPVIVPEGQVRGRFAGQRARTEVIDIVRYKSRRGWVERKSLWCPVAVLPTAGQIGAARREYLEWCSALLTLRASLPVDKLRLFSVTKAMPDLSPWKKTC